MLNINVRTILGMEKYLGGRKHQVIEMQENSDVMDLLNHLEDIFGEDFKHAIFDDQRNLNKGIALMLNGINIMVREGFYMKLREGDSLLIFPPAVGG